MHHHINHQPNRQCQHPRNCRLNHQAYQPNHQCQHHPLHSSKRLPKNCLILHWISLVKVYGLPCTNRQKLLVETVFLQSVRLIFQALDRSLLTWVCWCSLGERCSVSLPTLRLHSLDFAQSRCKDHLFAAWGGWILAEIVLKKCSHFWSVDSPKFLKG